jgi:hypothetical protein
MGLPPGVRVLSIPRGEALEVTSTPYGEVGVVVSEDDLEAVWVSKAAEEVDPDWFSQGTIDLLVVIQGDLKVEFPDTREDLVLTPGDAMVLPLNTRCRAYRWPRDAALATIFLAVYPKKEPT